ncbi:Na+/H+ antiporter NhaA [Sinisalibacter aestuarii]|uniref:Na(+)/H(+) antiporter NhaA n=1 Tax=Sinisalibacter aestuarii TaxID=2949426 RepID=A0ABQ5LUP0_9RHOB|nr:Na+/H+ antiporter NhaA [Sinisalibacter aestuarii]GKY88338.1 Na(+)/H(+) antiporter NhaA [Sinisalibacter aestuarii]
MISKLERLFKHEAAGGVMLMAAAVAALIVANSAFAPLYDATLGSYLAITLNGEGLEKPLILWINDGLMAIFFFLIGLELKREMMEGKLKKLSDVALPGVAAIGGMAVPALIFAAMNWSSPETLPGWAIPAATDIAFALGLLALVGSRAPAALKVFLLTLAILDDLGAILIIALFYTAHLKPLYLLLALAPLAAMGWLNARGSHRKAPIVILGIVLWVLVLKSGVHATLAGVVTAFFVPLKDRWGASPLKSMEHGLEPWVAFFIVPVFAFANAGVALSGMTADAVTSPLTLGIVAGLVLGKQIGVFGATWLMVRSGLARLPDNVTWTHIYGLSALAGIGFTMSLFIGGLSYGDPALMNEVRLGVLAASAISAVIGYGVLMSVSRKTGDDAEAAPAE